MRRVLFAYEFGAGLGHLNRLIAVARRLDGCHRVFALPDMSLEPVVRQALGQDVEVQAGVSWPPPADMAAARRAPTLSLADVLMLFGMHEPPRLARAVQTWRRLIEATRPDAVVADFAPSLRLATRGLLPTVLVGNGYTVPPAGRVLPPLRPWDEAVPAASRRHEAELLVAANEVAALAGGRSVDHLSDLLQGDTTFVCTLVEFDPYRGTRPGPTHWPFNIPDIPVGPAVAERTGASLFAYFQSGHPAVSSAIEALNGTKRRAEIFLQGADPARVAARCSPWIGVHRRPADLAATLPAVGGLLHHGGLGTALAGLMAGVPQIVCPLNLEHALTARGLETFGGSLTLPAAPSRPAMAQAVERLHDDASLASAAGRAALDLHARREPDSVAPVVAAVQASL